MREQRLVIAVVVVLVIIGAFCVFLRVRSMRSISLAPGESAWRLTYMIHFRTDKAGGRIRVAIPDSTSRARVFRETFAHPGVSMDLLRIKPTRDREAVLVPTLGDTEYEFVAESDIHLKPSSTPSAETIRTVLPPDEKARYLQKEKYIQLGSPQVTEIISSLTGENIKKEELLRRIFEYCAESIARGNAYDHLDAAGTLEANRGTTLGRARAMIALCRAVRVPARLVTGFIIENNENAQRHFWVEVYDKDEWVSYDPEYGHERDVPTTYLAVCRNDATIVRAQEKVEWQLKCAIGRIGPSPAIISSEDKWPVSVLDLTRLPPGMQQVVALILLLPIAALITAIFRHLIGIETYGTFGPGLLALSMVYADWIIGAVIFAIIISVGLVSRFVLNYMKLHMVARLGVILTCIVVCMTLSVSVLDYLELTPSARAVLLPMVILTMMAERFSVTVEEDGFIYGVKVFIGTLVVAACCLVMLQIENLGRLVLTFPEVHCFVVAAMLLIGRYAGYRLTELWRFRDLAAPEVPES